MKDDNLEKIKLAIIPGVKKEQTPPKNRNRKTVREVGRCIPQKGYCTRDLTIYEDISVRQELEELCYGQHKTSSSMPEKWSDPVVSQHDLWCVSW